MNILILNWRDPKHPLAGGAEKSVFEHAKYWKEKGANVSWFASSFDNAKKEEFLNGIKILRAGNYYTTHFLFFVHYLLGKFKEFEVVVDCFHFGPYFTPLYVKKAKKIALIQETAGRLWFKNTNPVFAFIGFLFEPLFFLFYRNTQFITASESTKKDLIKLGIKSEKVHIIPHGVDIGKSSANKEKNPTILYLGLLSKDKGFGDASEAASLIKKDIKNLQYWIAGKESKGGDFNWYVGRARKFAKYFGFVSNEKKFDLYKKAWILVHPSEKEGWGLTVIEAATQGTPAVGYDVEGLRDSVKNEKTGILTKKTPESLAETVVALIMDKKRLNKMSSQAIEWSQNFDWNKAGLESWQLINKL